MLDENIKVEKKEKKEYPPLPENIYQVELLDVSSGQRPTYETRFKPEDEQVKETVLKFQFTLLAGKQGGEDLRGRNVWVNFVPTYLYIGKNGKNTLYRIIESLLGRDLDPQEEAEGVDGKFLNALVGKQCRIGTKHKKSKDGSKVFDNVETYYAIEQEMTSLTEEEKENARVKEKESKEADKAMEDMAETPEIDPDDIPF